MTLPSSPGVLDAPMLNDPYASHVWARLGDFFLDTSPWPRRLWDVSTVLALQEAWEAGDWQEQKVLSEGAVRWYVRELEAQLGPDPGLGDRDLRKELTGLLRTGLPPDSSHRRRLKELLPLINNGYLTRWLDAVSGPRRPSPERLARAVATHLLDRGWSSGYLFRWIKDYARVPDATLRDLLEFAADLAAAGDSDFEVLVPFLVVPRPQLAAARLEWRDATQCSTWFSDNGLASVRQNGGFLYSIRAKDAVAAARQAGGLVQALQARTSFDRDTSGELMPVGHIWIAAYPERLPLQPPDRAAQVLSLGVTETLYAAIGTDRLDDALEMAAPLNQGAPAPAVTGAWSAIESLLYYPGDAADREEGRTVAAGRLAALIACSWPRAELTGLSHRHKPDTPDDLARVLQNMTTNAHRCEAVADALAAGAQLTLTKPSDVAACERMRRMLLDPRKELGDVRRVFTGAMRRFYRQRNIVAHSGHTNGVALDAALRTTAPLIGAGLDRLVHAKLSDSLEPLDLAARAENSLALVGDPLGPHVTKLLD
jgi:hypothetical protein